MLLSVLFEQSVHAAVMCVVGSRRPFRTLGNNSTRPIF